MACALLWAYKTQNRTFILKDNHTKAILFVCAINNLTIFVFLVVKTQIKYLKFILKLRSFDDLSIWFCLISFMIAILHLIGLVAACQLPYNLWN
jgi:hypothetical protein